MNRLKLVELEDQLWVPRTLRDGATDVLDVLTAKAGVYRPLAPRLAAFMEAVGNRCWLDLYSGGGGALARRDECGTARCRPCAPIRQKNCWR